jgi:hypothetical protein
MMFYVLTEMIMKSKTFWVLTPFNSERDRSFGGTYSLKLQDWSEKPAEAVTMLLVLARLTLRPWRWRRYPPPNIGSLQNRWRYKQVRTFQHVSTYSMMMFQVFTVLNIKIVHFRDVMQYSLEEGYERFRETCYLSLQGTLKLTETGSTASLK